MQKHDLSKSWFVITDQLGTIHESMIFVNKDTHDITVLGAESVRKLREIFNSVGETDGGQPEWTMTDR